MRTSQTTQKNNNLDYYRKKPLFFKLDILIFAVVILAVVFSILIITDKTEGQTVEIYYKGELIETHSFQSQKIITIDRDNTHNIISIQNGTVHMYESNCPDQLCVKAESIRYANQRIICAPNGVVVIIKGGDDIDGITGGNYAD